MKTLPLALLVVLTGVFAMPVAAHADDAKKPPIVIQSGNKKYVISSDSEKFREILLRADKVTIKHRRDDDDWKKDYYKNYYKHHKFIRDHEETDRKPRGRASYDSGYVAGYLLSDD